MSLQGLQKAATKLIAKQAAKNGDVIEDAGVAISRALVPNQPIPVGEGLRKALALKRANRVGRDKNVAFAEVDMGTGVRLDLHAASGKHHFRGFVPPPGSKDGISALQRRFLTQVTGNNARRVDSEVILLEHLANTIPSFAKGRIRLFSELPPCSSCSDVIDQFRRLFPNMEVIVSHGPRAVN